MFRHLLATLAAGALMLAVLASPSSARAEDLSIFAAISLKTPLEKARPELEKAAGMPIQFNYGASGTLCTQILRGAPAAIFISADQLNVEKLKKENRAVDGSEKVLVSNDLVLITPAAGAAIKKLADLGQTNLTKLAIGEPRIVPAGKYAQQTLTHLKLYDALKDAGKLVMGENVAQVLAYVERGEVDAGLVYRTDVLNSSKVTIVDVAADDAHEPIVYVMAIIKDAPNPDAARKVHEKLVSPEIQGILMNAGFKPVTNIAKK